MKRKKTAQEKLFDRALKFQERGDRENAIRLYNKLLAANPDHLEARFNLAVIHHDSGELETALAGYKQCLNLAPDLAEAYKNIGDIKIQQHAPQAAKEAYRRALSLRPQAATWHNLGIAEAASGHSEAAQQAWRQALALEPGHLPAATALLESLLRTRAFQAAEKLGQILLERFPGNTQLEILTARIEWTVGHLGRAEVLCRRQLEQQANNPDALNLLGLIRMQLGDPAEGVNLLRQALQANPELPAVHSNLLYCSLMTAGFSPAAYLDEARNWTRRHIPIGTPQSAPLPPRISTDRLHLAFISPDLRRHSVAFFLLPLLKNLVRDRFQITLYADHPQDDDYSAKLREHCDSWHKIYDLSNDQVEELLRREQPAMLVELAGHSANNRLPLLGRRPVAIIVSWLGYPASTGLEEGFYRFGDELVDPPGAERFYSEKLLHLPAPFICYEPPPEARELPTGAPGQEKVLTFASFNNPAKINSTVVATWCQLLQRIPGSRLLLKNKIFRDPETCDIFRQRFLKCGLQSERLVLHPGNPDLGEHFAMYREVDIALDTFPYNGTTTTCEALYMGVPVIGLRGNHHAARVGATLLETVGLSELVADDLEQYQEIAANLAATPARRAKLRRELRPRMEASPLLDGKGFAEKFSAAIVNLVKKTHATQQPVSNSRHERPQSETGQTVPPAPPPATKPNLQPLLEKACALHNQGQLDKAEVIYNYIIDHDPDRAGWAALNLARLNRIRQTPARGVAGIERVLARTSRESPLAEELFCELANLYHQLKLDDRARDALEQALAANPDNFQALNNLGSLLLARGRPEEATTNFARALEIKPDQPEIIDNFILCCMLNSDWSRIARLTDRDTGKPDRPPTSTRLFIDLAANDSVAANFHLARLWYSLHATDDVINYSKQSFHRRPDHQQEPEMLKIAYLSGDFRDHPVAHNLVGMFTRHNRKRFQVSAYSFGPDDDSGYQARIAAGCDHFIDISHLNDRDAARRIHEDGIDILIELMGHTRNNRLTICAFRPAPVQISYLGYPGTTGADFIDYLIADPIVIPPEQKQFYSEKILYLPNCFMLADRPDIAPRPSRRECGLPENGTIFASFNNAYKIEPVMFDIWMRILKDVPKSVLWLRPGSRLMQENLRREAANRGVAPERLIFATWAKTKAAHLARLQLADLVLDTRIYNGHTTTLDALWAGVPVVTVPGGHFASRVSASQLHAIGLEKLICNDLEGYHRLAVELARNPARLQDLKKQLAQNRKHYPLFDTETTVRNLELAYLQAWQDRFSESANTHQEKSAADA